MLVRALHVAAWPHPPLLLPLLLMLLLLLSPPLSEQAGGDGGIIASSTSPVDTTQHVVEQQRLAHGRGLKEAQERVTMFCFTLALPGGHHPALLMAQLRETLGIFGCDSHLVVSTVSAEQLLHGHHVPPFRSTIVAGVLGGSRPPNDAAIFAKAWKQVFTDGAFKKQDWTVKLDVDVVIVPGVLRHILAVHCKPNQNCGPLYLEDASSMIQGPIQALNKEATAYFGAYGNRCVVQTMLGKASEVTYLSHCLKSLMIRSQQEPNLLLHLHHNSHCDADHAAFHPVESWAQASKCLKQSGWSDSAGSSVSSHGHSGADRADAPAMLCLSLVRPGGVEALLVSQQYVAGVGIFSCDGYILLSNISSKDLFKQGLHPPRWPGRGPEVTIIEGQLEALWPLGLSPANIRNEVPQTSKTMVMLGAGIFVKVWRAIFIDRRYQRFDWTLKLDPSAAFLPLRLRNVLRDLCPDGVEACGARYAKNAGKFLHGPVEALTRDAVQTYADGHERCMKDIDFKDKSEDRFLRLCLDLLHVEGVQVSKLLRDIHVPSMQIPQCKSDHAVFHPFRYWDEFRNCLNEAGYLLHGPAHDPQVSWTLPSAKLAAPSLFCWALVVPAGAEPALLAAERIAGVGIFSCDGHLVISNQSVPRLQQNGGVGRFARIDADLYTPKGGRYMTALNSPVFIKAWHAVFEDGSFQRG